MGVSGYRSVRTIAKGGMAEVSLAVQTGLAGFEKLVVVKRILPHLCSDGQFVQMLLDEARLAASLRHPNIVQIYDVRRDEESFSIVMEYLQGEDLRYIVRTQARQRRYLPVPIVCRVIADVAAGLDAAHRATDTQGRPKEVVHRDVSPTNVMVTYDGVPKVLDFGVAKANVHNIYTAPGSLKGKLAYASPEQIEQKGVDGRSDLFSLGVVTYELLTARRLFRGDTSAAILQAVMNQEIAPPSSFNRRIPPELDHVVLSALRRDREERTHTAGLFRTQLEWVLKHMGEAISNHDVADWMREAFAERFNQRLALERESATVSVDEAGSQSQLQPMFTVVKDPSHEGPGPDVPTPAQSGLPVAAAPQSTTRVVVLTVLATLALVALVLGAYWVGRHDPAAGVALAPPPGPATPGGDRAAEAIAGQPALAARAATATAGARDAGARQPPAAASPKREGSAPSQPIARPKIPRAPPPSSSEHGPLRTSAPAGEPGGIRRSRGKEDGPRPRPRRPPLRRKGRGEGSAESARAAGTQTRDKPRTDFPAQPPRPLTFPVLAEPTVAPLLPKAKSSALPKAKSSAPAKAKSSAPPKAKSPAPPEPGPSAKAKPASSGAVRIGSDVDGYVFVDGRHTGKSTPVLLRLPPGEHEISVVLKGNNTRLTQKVRVKAGTTVRLKFVE